MTLPSEDPTKAAWAAALTERDVDAWIEHVDRIGVSDHFGFLESVGATQWEGRALKLHDWINALSRQDDISLLNRIRGAEHSVQESLATATFAWWRSNVERLLLDSNDSTIPARSIVQYFSDRLAVSVIMEYRKTGSTVELLGTFAFPRPAAILDPLEALQYVRDSGHLALLRASLYSRHKILIQRNVLIHVDRELSGDVFGPSIDTLLLNDFLFEHRYRAQRTPDNSIHFEEAMTRNATHASLEAGTRFVEIGCGNGLLTATFAKNEAKIRSFAALDISMSAIAVTHLNSARQRLLHRGMIGDRGIYIAAPYRGGILPADNDLVVCNPPYVPVPEQLAPSGSHGTKHAATLGTDLLREVVGDVSVLVGDSGELIVVLSELAEPELISSVPAGWRWTREERHRVPFRLDSLDLHQDAGLLDWLADERGLERDEADGIESHQHSVAIYRIRKGDGRDE